MKRKVTERCLDEDDARDSVLRRRLQLDQSGILGHCFQTVPRFGAFLPSDRIEEPDGASSSLPKRHRLRLPRKFGRPALMKAAQAAIANGAAAQDVLDWDTPEFAEEPSASSASLLAAPLAENGGGLLLQNVGHSSSSKAMVSPVVSSPAPEGTGASGDGSNLLAKDSTVTPPGTAAQPPALPSSPPGPNAPGTPATTAPPSVQEGAAAGILQPFTFVSALGQHSAPAGTSGGGGQHAAQQAGSSVLGVFGAAQQIPAAVAQLQPAQPLAPQAEVIFGQPKPEQVGLSIA